MHKIRGFVLGFIVWVIYKILSMTWKTKIIETDSMKTHMKEKKPMILAHFHGDEIPLISLVSRYKIATMSSTSKDGEMMNTILKLLVIFNKEELKVATTKIVAERDAMVGTNNDF